MKGLSFIFAIVYFTAFVVCSPIPIAAEGSGALRRPSRRFGHHHLPHALDRRSPFDPSGGVASYGTKDRRPCMGSLCFPMNRPHYKRIGGANLSAEEAVLAERLAQLEKLKGFDRWIAENAYKFEDNWNAAGDKIKEAWKQFESAVAAWGRKHDLHWPSWLKAGSQPNPNQWQDLDFSVYNVR